MSEESAFTAEATELELSWATGNGLPICCISDLAVAEAGRGSGCRALKEATVSKLFGNNYWNFFKAALWTRNTLMETNTPDRPDGNCTRKT